MMKSAPFTENKKPKLKGIVMPVALKEQSGGRTLEVRATGKIAANDYVELVPTFERLKKQHGKLRVLFELHDFHGWTAGSLWEDLKFEEKHFSDIERLAVIGETKWQKGMTEFCKPFTSAQIRFFAPNQAEAARQWLAIQRQETVAVAVFNTHADAEAVVKALAKTGYDMKTLSIVGQDYHSPEDFALHALESSSSKKARPASVPVAA